jgi:hypothetical protein
MLKSLIAKPVARKFAPKPIVGNVKQGNPNPIAEALAAPENMDKIELLAVAMSVPLESLNTLNMKSLNFSESDGIQNTSHNDGGSTLMAVDEPVTIDIIAKPNNDVPLKSSPQKRDIATMGDVKEKRMRSEVDYCKIKSEFIASGIQRLSTYMQKESILPPTLYGPQCPYVTYTVYLRKHSAEGLGIKIKNVEEVPVVVGFEPSFALLQNAAMTSKMSIYDVIVAVNNVDIRSCSASNASVAKRGKRKNVGGTSTTFRSNFDKIIAALRDTSCISKSSKASTSNSFSNSSNAVSISLSTIDSNIVCITLARPLNRNPITI